MKTQTAIEELQTLFQQYKEEAIKDYFTFLKFESVSSEPSYKDQVLACAKWVSSYLTDAGFLVESWPTSGYPTIFAHYDRAGPDQPTLLIYNHYDVQPVDPLDLWESAPFVPTVRDGEVYARGAQDNKGQCFYVLLALKAILKSTGSLPVNIKLCIEGEEECGSTGLSGILKERKKDLKADYLAIVDLGLPNLQTPTITLGVRGLVTMDVEVTCTRTDIHSGSHGGIVYNPIHAIIKLLGDLRNSDGKIGIPGFYDDVKPVSDTEKSLVSLEFDSKTYESNFGTKATGGEREFSPLERNWFRPTFEINGINGGYSGDGFKTVIPAKATAKVSCRLVPNQEPSKIGALVSAYLKKNAPEGTQVNVSIHSGSGTALRASADSKIATAFATAYQEIFHKECKRIYSGASIPVVTELAKACGGEVILVGLGLPGDCIHAPNEHFGLNRIEMGFLSIARVLQLMGKQD